jgi:hypothetical protein
MRAFLAFLAIVGVVALLVYLGQPQFTTTASQHTKTIVDNHTIVTITNNVPPDYSSVAFIIIALAGLLYVVFHVVLPYIREWRRNSR